MRASLFYALKEINFHFHYAIVPNNGANIFPDIIRLRSALQKCDSLFFECYCIIDATVGTSRNRSPKAYDNHTELIFHIKRYFII